MTAATFLRVGARALVAAGALASIGCAGGFLSGSAPKARGTVPPVPVERPDPPLLLIPSDPVEPEPEPAPSDAEGVARLQQLAFVWQLVATHHPIVSTGGVPWDSAFIRAVPRVRAATSPKELESAYARLLRAVEDPLTRVESEARPPLPAPAPGRVTASRTADSVLLVRLPPAPQYGGETEALLRAALQGETSRVVLDLRGTPGTAVPPAWGLALDRLLARTRLASALAWRSTRLPGERLRVVGGSRSTEGTVAPEDGWRLREGALLPADGIASRRVVVVANPTSLLPRALLALVGSRQAALVAEGGVRDDALVSSVVVSAAPGLSVRVRTGVLVHADGSVGIPVDAVAPTLGGLESPDSAPAVRAALALARGEGPWPARRPVTAAPFPVLPRYYQTEPYPFLGARVLAGARLWAAMRGRHAHRDLYDDDLDDAFTRAIPALEAARSEGEYVQALRGMVASFDDAQVQLEGATADSAVGGASAPFRTEAVDGSVLVTAVARDAETRALGIEEGQEVTAADGFPLAAWRTEHRRDVAAPNQWTREERTVRLLPRGPAGGTLFRLRDPSGRERQVNVARRASYRAQLPVVERPLQGAVRTLAPGIRYVDVERLPMDSLRALLDGARGLRGVVLDLRGRLPEPVSAGALDSAVAPVAAAPATAVRGRVVVAREVLRWRQEPCLVPVWREAAQQCAESREERPLEVEAPPPPSGAAAPRVVALIDARTQGAMERLAMRLEALAGVTFVGSPSAGSPSEVMPLALPGGLTVTIPLTEWRRPDGGAVQRVGITPQVAAQRTVRGVRAGRDEVLERAQQWLQEALDAPAGRRRE